MKYSDTIRELWAWLFGSFASSTTTDHLQLGKQYIGNYESSLILNEKNRYSNSLPPSRDTPPLLLNQFANSSETEMTSSGNSSKFRLVNGVSLSNGDVSLICDCCCGVKTTHTGR